jgi:hypothetical protein
MQLFFVATVPTCDLHSLYLINVMQKPMCVHPEHLLFDAAHKLVNVGVTHLQEAGAQQTGGIA